MTDEQIALAKRAVACRGWRWMRGMSNDRGQTIDYVDLIAGKAYCGEWDADITALPDLTDPATLGCLLALVREAWDQGSITPQVVSNKKWLLIYKGFGTPSRFFYGTTEVKVLVVALEAAP